MVLVYVGDVNKMKPKFIAIAAITIDGKIAQNKKHMSDWTSPEDKLFMRALLNKCDVVIVGNNTYKTAIKPLSKRNCIVFSRSENQTNQMNRIYVNPEKTDIKKLINNLPAFAPGFGGLPSKNKNKVGKKIAILGGAQTYAYCLANNMLDELYLTIEPLVFGKGINLFEGKNFLNSNFKLISIKKLNKQGSLLLKYHLL